MGDTAFSRFSSWIVISILSIAIAILVTVSLRKLQWQFDLTEDARYTLPVEASEIASELEDDLNITVYLSESLPSYLSHMPRILRRRLDEIASASGGKISFSFVDPESDPDLLAELKDLKMEARRLQDMKEGQQTTGTYWLWMLFRYRDQTQSFDLVQLGRALVEPDLLLATLPYHLCARIVKVSKPETKIGLIAEMKPVPPQLQRNFGKKPTALVSTLMKGIESHYPPVKQVNIKTGLQVPDDISTLVIYRPETMSDREIYEIDQFLMRGGRILVLLDSIATFEMDRFQEFGPGLQAGDLPVRTLDVSMKKWLAHFGVVMEDGYVEDRENATFVVGPPRMTRVGGRLAIQKNEKDAPGFVVARERNEDGPTGQFSSESPVFDGLGQVGMILPAVLRVDSDWKKRHPRAQLRELLRTSSEAWVRKPEGGKVKIWGQDPPARAEWGSFPLAVAMNGHFQSFWSGKDRPPRMGPNGKELPDGPRAAAKIDESASDGQLWVIADTEFCSDVWPGILRQKSPEMLAPATRMQGGLVNALDALTLGDKLIKIRKPNLKDRAVDTKRVAKQKDRIKWIAVALAPGIILALGILRLIARVVLTAKPGIRPRKTAEKVFAERDALDAAATEESSS